MTTALSSEMLSFRPCLPKEIEEISFQIVWKGQRVRVAINKNSLTLNNLSEKELPFVVFDKTAFIEAGEEASVSY